MPEILNIRRHAGVAGQYSFSAVVQYDDEPAETVVFVGSSYGGPIVMKTSRSEVFVSESVLDRLGHTLDESWVRGFFTD